MHEIFRRDLAGEFFAGIEAVRRAPNAGDRGSKLRVFKMHGGDARRIIQHPLAGDFASRGTAADVGLGEMLFNVLQDAIFHVGGCDENKNQLRLVGL